MRILQIAHAPFESPAYFSQWADNHNYEMAVVHPYNGDLIPDHEQFDMLLIMGGPQTPLKIKDYPYLKDEIKAAQSFIQHDKYVIGVCLGAQLIGESLGAKTEQSPFSEVGVFPVNLTLSGKQDRCLTDFPDSLKVSHWHNDMPGIPSGSEILATSEGCPRQIVRFTPKAYGFQCHMEFNQNCVRDMLTHCADHLKPGQYIQDKEYFMNHNYDEMNYYLSTFLERFIRQKNS